MRLDGTRVLVTGADGFIGSHLTERLVRVGARVRAFVFYSAFDSHGWLDALPPAVSGEVEVVMGDVRDAERVDRAAAGCEVVFHLAALIGIPYSYTAPRSYVETNVTGTLNVLEAARHHAVARVVHTSTSEVYGTARYVPMDEDHPLSARSPYAATKIAADQLALAYHRTWGTPVAVLRPFNTYGPRQSVRAVIPSIVLQLLDHAPTVRLGNVEPTRDFNFVEDVVSGFLAAAGTQAALGEVIHIGSGYEVPIRRAAELIAEVLGRPLEIVAQDAARSRPDGSEVERLCADPAKARRVLGWEPAVAGEAGRRRAPAATADWFSRRENRARYGARDFAL
jgi:NAD dependent epimerase/dehydratase